MADDEVQGGEGDPASPTADDGWQGIRAYGARLVLPSFTMRRAREETDRLLGVRAVWASTVGIHVIIGLIALLSIATASTTGSWSVGLGLALVVLVGAGVLYARWRIAARPLDCGDARALADDYYIRFLKETAMVSLVLPWGIIAGLFTGSVAVTGVAAAIAAAGLTWMAPTRAAVAGQARALVDGGCDVDLVAVLQSGGAAGAGRRPGRGGAGGGGRPGAGGGSAGGGNRSKKKRKRR